MAVGSITVGGVVDRVVHTGPMHAPPRRTQRGWEAIAVAALAHAALFTLFDDVLLETARLRLGVASIPPAAAERTPTATALDPQAVGLIAALPPALSLDAILGAGDDLGGTGRTARPSDADLPGDRAADRGGGADGGAETWADRRDRADDAALRKQVWTSDHAYLAPRSAGRRPAASPEAIARRLDRTYGDREPRPLAVPGGPAATVGDARGVGNGGVPTSTGDDAARRGRAGATDPLRRAGATTRVREAAFVDPGERAVDVARRGPTSDDRAVAASSDQRRPDPFDLTPPRSGGTAGEGVRGVAAPGIATDGWGAGTEASRAFAEPGDGGAATYASRRDPYFLELFRKLDQRIVYPRELAIALVSGRVVAQLTLRADGTVRDLGLHASSGHPQFDDQVTGALRAMKLGPVPSAILAGRGEVRVRIPYTFKSPVIQ